MFSPITISLSPIAIGTREYNKNMWDNSPDPSSTGQLVPEAEKKNDFCIICQGHKRVH